MLYLKKNKKKRHSLTSVFLLITDTQIQLYKTIFYVRYFAKYKLECCKLLSVSNIFVFVSFFFLRSIENKRYSCNKEKIGL